MSIRVPTDTSRVILEALYGLDQRPMDLPAARLPRITNSLLTLLGRGANIGRVATLNGFTWGIGLGARI